MKRTRDPELALAHGEELLSAAAEAHAADDPEEAERLARSALVVMQRALGADDPNLAPALTTLGRIAADRDDDRLAIRYYRRAATLLAPLRADPDALALELDARRGLAYALIGRARYAEVRPHLEATLRLCRRASDPLETAKTLNALGMLCKYTGRFVAGLRYYRRALGLFEAHDPEGEDLVALHHNLGGIHHARGAFAEALPHARASVALRTRLTGPDSLASAIELAALAPVLDGLAQAATGSDAAALMAESAAVYERVIPVFRAAGRDYDLAVALHNLAALRCDAGDAAGAEAAYREAIAIKRAHFGARHPDLALTMHNLGVLLADTNPAEAHDLAAAAAEILTATLGKQHPHAQVAAARLASLDPRSR